MCLHVILRQAALTPHIPLIDKHDVHYADEFIVQRPHLMVVVYMIIVNNPWYIIKYPPTHSKQHTKPSGSIVKNVHYHDYYVTIHNDTYPQKTLWSAFIYLPLVLNVWTYFTLNFYLFLWWCVLVIASGRSADSFDYHTIRYHNCCRFASQLSCSKYDMSINRVNLFFPIILRLLAMIKGTMPKSV